ncbi:MAG TPA: ABC transporter substrate-binding protein [Steroidobacteraceae bacterium]|jgi:branched-chain amino acid transport system substrate-binding protein|nr:ABC transporter substrate-binding protein [Steroidobacteraceae bacterium]
MTKLLRWTTCLVLALSMGGPPAVAASSDVVIGDIDDLSGVYSENGGMGGVEAIKMAIADFGGAVLGRKIVVLYADHQNKADIGASKAREWSDQHGLNMLLWGANTAAAIATAKIIEAKKIPYFVIGSVGASLTNEDCTAYTVHYVVNTTSLANGTASTVAKAGGKTWFFLTADYSFGTQLQAAASKVVEANGGKNIGAVRVPLSTSDFSSFLLQAQSSGAQVLGLANAGDDFINSLKSATEFGLTQTMKPAGLLVFVNNIDALGLKTAQGLYLTTAWYWDLNPETRAFGKRFFDKMKREPSMLHSGYYSATLTYLNAVKAAGTTDADKVMSELKKAKINDMFAKNGYIRADGLMVHDMYVMQVKPPQESKYPWDYYKIVKVMTGEEAFGPITGLCPLAPN